MKARYAELYRLYRKAWDSPLVHSHGDAVKMAVNSPTDRYWISPSEAARHILKLERGKDCSYMKDGEKYQMIKIIYEKYKELRKSKYLKDAPRCYVTALAIQTPAPRMFISQWRARRIIKKIKSGEYDIY